ncbi:MAG: prenyltransferase/squalene oxidase repeat-containing protein [Candidatus Syntropharchaeia archaeon]
MSMEKVVSLFLISLILFLSMLTPSAAVEYFPLKQDDSKIQAALNYLRTLQNPDGGFSNPGEKSEVGKTEWVVIAIAAAGEDPHEWIKNRNSPIDYLRANSENLEGSTEYERMILALVASGEDPRNFNGTDYVEILKREYLKENRQFSDYIHTTIWGILALAAVGEDVSSSVEWLKKQQNSDGGFGWAVGEPSDYDDTAAAIEALIAAGMDPRDKVIRDALDYLRTGQLNDGGFRYFGTSASNAASDAWVIRALVAAGENPLGWKKNGKNPVDHLLSLQQPDGSFNYTKYVRSNPGYMTASAIPALLGRTYPIYPVESKTSAEGTPVIATPSPSPTPPSLSSISTPEVTPTPFSSPSPATIPAPGSLWVLVTILLVSRICKRRK